jgi:hypothetical protein
MLLFCVIILQAACQTITKGERGRGKKTVSHFGETVGEDPVVEVS